MKSKQTNNNCLYLHTTLDNKIFYVGIGRIKRAYSKCNRNTYWHNIVNKYGYNVTILVESLTWEEACNLEIKMIAFYGRRIPNSDNLNYGCLVNMSDGGEGAKGKIVSVESRKKMSESAKKKPTVSIESRKKMSESQKKRTSYAKGFKHSEEARKKMSETRKGRTGWNKGLKHTEDTIKKMSESHKGNTAMLGHKHTKETKKKMSESSTNKKSVIQYDLEGNFICRYNSMGEAAKKLNIHQSNITNVCKGINKKTGGFVFKYEIV